ncbi:MAG: hypothetical protein JEZ12_17900 [Desulfobacterium sp.]|nr:hypothetical protein [Desulfobacterium sp.]
MGSIHLASGNTFSSNPLSARSAEICGAKFQDSSPVIQGESASQALAPADAGMKGSEEDTQSLLSSAFERVGKARERADLSELAITLGVLEQTLAGVVSQLNNQERSDFLLSVVKTGDRVGKFIDTTRHLTGRQRKEFLALSKKLSKKGGHNFQTVSQNPSQDLERMIDTASNLLGEELDNYLSAAAMAGKDLSMLVKEVNRRLEDSGPPGGKELSGFLSAAARSTQNVMILISTIQNVSERIGSKILAYINTHDSGDSLDDFISIVDGAGERAMDTDTDPPPAGEDRATPSRTASHADFDSGEFLSRVENMGVDEESYFLKMVSGAAETTGELMEVINAVTQGEQKAFLVAGRDLVGNTLKNYIQGANTAAATSPAGTFSNLVGLTRELNGSDREYLLEASATAEPKALSDLMTFTKDLGETLGGKPGEKRIALARNNFLMLASDAGHNLERLIGMAETLIEMGGEAFIEGVNSAAKTGKSLGAFVQAYV